MSFDCEKWLNEPTNHRGTFNGKPLHQYLSYLIVANGGLEVHGWGFLSYGSGHQCGLEQNEALSLLELVAFMRGLESGGVLIFDTFKPHFDAYVAAAVARRDQAKTAQTEVPP